MHTVTREGLLECTELILTYRQDQRQADVRPRD